MPSLKLALGLLAGLALLAPPRAAAKPLTKPTVWHGVLLTEYWAVPEKWFAGAMVSAPGLPGKHRVDWLYSSKGVSMEGDGIGLDGKPYHIDQIGSSGWVNEYGKRTVPGRSGWSNGSPFWRAGSFWRNRHGNVTFPLDAGGWFDGAGTATKPLTDVTFAPGQSRPLTAYRSVAVDPSRIPLGSRIYIPAYKGVAGSDGWFVAADTGGAIIGHHLDVYRPAPSDYDDPGNATSGQSISIYPPGT